MKIGSLFTGVGGFDLGFERAGHTIEWQVEFDKRAQSVLRRHWPQVELYSDVRKVRGGDFRSGYGRREREREFYEKQNTSDGNFRRSSDRADEGTTSNILAPVDLICGGFPCQDLSLAGGRKGLAGERSGLWFQYHRIISEVTPTWILIENVLGLLSSNDGADMRVVLRGLEELGYGWNYRVLDSQFFGVPQRRRRVFIVGHLGGACPPEILLEPESVRGGTPPSRKERQKITEVAQGGLEESDTGTGHWNGGVHPTLDAGGPNTSDQSLYSGGGLVWDDDRIMMRGGGFSNYKKDDIAGCLRAAGDKGTDVDLILEQPSNEEQQTKAFYEVTPSLVVGTPSGNGAEEQLVVGAAPQHEAFKKTTRGKGHADWADGEITSTLTDHDLGNDTFMQEMIVSSDTVIPRRLTPKECERLQGFPDDWTRYTDNDEEVTDGHRYKQMGNAVTVNVAQWLGERFNLYLSKGDER